MLLCVITREPSAPTIESLNVSARPRIQRVSSVIEIAFSALCFGYGVIAPKPWLIVTLGAFLLWDAMRILGWKLEMTPEHLRIRRYFLWRSIPWTQINSVSIGDTWGRGQKAVRLSLISQLTCTLGAFGAPFAVAVCDCLRTELVRRRGVTPL